MTTPWSWQFPVVHFVNFLHAFFYQLISRQVFSWEGSSSNTCCCVPSLWARAQLSHTTALLLLPLSLNHRLALSPYNPLSKHKQTNKTVDFSFCSNIKLFSALICLTPFPDSVFFHLQKCYQAFLDTKSRHTENQLGVLSPHRNIQT